MILAIVGIVGAVVLITCASNGEWGSFAIGAVIIAIVFIMAFDEKQESKAYMNWQRYWATGKLPEEQKRNVSTERRLTHNERKENERRLREEVRRNQAYKYRATLTCPKCGVSSRMEVRPVDLDGKRVLKSTCPQCGHTFVRE